MTKLQLRKFINWLGKEGYSIIGPVKESKQISIKGITRPKELDLSNRLPLYSFKKYLIPPKEILFEYAGQQFKSQLVSKKQALFGMSIFDLKALLLYNHVFEKDPYYQARRQNTLIIGQVRMPPPQFPSFQIWQEKYEEDVLEHLQFDIFLGSQRKNGKGINFRIYTGTRIGQEILESFGYKNYEHIQFAGPIKEEGVEPQILEVREKMSKYFNPKIWEKLGKICIECGKCSLVCPTCFCFDMKDEPDLKKSQGVRTRRWTTCFYEDFSEIAGGHKFLATTSEKIHNWYWHKFVRIPDEYSFPGCVGCSRCSMVCPAGIDICKVLSSIRGRKKGEPEVCKIL